VSYLNPQASGQAGAPESLLAAVAPEPAETTVTVLSVSVANGPTIAGIDYPSGEERKFPFADVPIRVYEGSVTIAVRFNGEPLPADVLNLSVTYQACDDSACLPPVTKRAELRTE